MRFLGIDPGTKRLGLARGDELGLAFPLPALVHPAADERWAALLETIETQCSHEVVVGYPLNMDGSVGPKAREARILAQRLRQATGLTVHLVDERLSSHAVKVTIPPAKLREMRHSGVIDSRAATLILQDYLDQRFPSSLPEEAP